jgi:hypothetical protein
MIDVTLPNDFTPRPYQERVMAAMDNGAKRVFWVVHRRGGKDLTFLHQTCKMMHVRQGVYWHIFPSFSQARKAIWEGFTKEGKRILENVFPGFLDPKRPGSIVKRKDEQQMMLEMKCGSIWRLMGSDRIELVGAGPVGFVFSEFAISDPRAWNMIRPMLRENEGWAAFITTPRGPNHAKDLFDLAVKDPTWFTETQTLYDTRAYDPDKTIAEERASGMPEALIKQEYLCDWNAALVGSVWGDLIDLAGKAGAFEPFTYDYDEIFTSWDLGFTDSTVIWFWRVVDGGVDVVDYYENHGASLSHYFDLIESKPYKYIKHWLPHDARQVTLSSGVSILNQMLKRYPGQVACGPDLPLLDGIQAGRWLIQQGVRFHPNVAQGLAALRQYHYEYDEEKKTFSPKPFHDWSSHAADAWRYLASVVKTSEILTKRVVEAAPKPVAKPLHMSFTLNQLFEDRARDVRKRRRI